MPLQSIIVVFLRISAIQFIVTALTGLIQFVSMNTLSTTSVLLILNYPILAIIMWIFALPISRFVTRENDVSVSLGGLTRTDLYAFAFVYLGLSFFVTGIGSAVTNLYILLNRAIYHPGVQDSLNTQCLQQLEKQSIQVIFGFICLFNANRFAKKLGSRE